MPLPLGQEGSGEGCWRRALKPQDRTQHLPGVQSRSDKAHWQSTRSRQPIPSLAADSIPNAVLEFIVQGEGKY